jgi:hypothetical protein
MIPPEGYNAIVSTSPLQVSWIHPLHIHTALPFTKRGWTIIEDKNEDADLQTHRAGSPACDDHLQFGPAAIIHGEGFPESA